MLTPSASAAARASSLSSQAQTSASLSCSARAVAIPDRPRPNTATGKPAKGKTSIMIRLPQLQGRKTRESQDRRDDPEADHDGALRPALLFEMMMQGRHRENTFAR